MADEEAPPGMWLSKGTKSPVFQLMRRAAYGHRGNVDGVLQHYLPSFPRIRAPSHTRSIARGLSRPSSPVMPMTEPRTKSRTRREAIPEHIQLSSCKEHHDGRLGPWFSSHSLLIPLTEVVDTTKCCFGN
ncbi:hypothetical protein LY78DRAFT_205926 [Colletotrichum sublineola]|nr:hypothetical protein LY78DRAFT_205926 [Colletotrichum sublineola]